MKILLIVVVILITFKALFIFLEQKGLYHPYKEIPETPKNLGIAFEEINFKTTDGQLLNGWFVPGKDAKITVLYCHGNAGNMYHRLHKVKFFHETEVNFFIFD